MGTNRVTVGMLGETPIVVDIGRGPLGIYPNDTITAKLTADYKLLHPPGFPNRYQSLGKHFPWPSTLKSGWTVKLLRPEADALVAAGAAAYV
jgi:hypothetical protein